MGYFFLICIGIVYFLAYIFYEDTFHKRPQNQTPTVSKKPSLPKRTQTIDTVSMLQSCYLWSENKLTDLKAALITMSCEPHPSTEKGSMLLFFQYQGENLVAIIRENSKLVEIHDPYWYEVDPRDIDRFAEMKRIINEINISLFGVTLYYTLDKEKDIAQVTTAAQIPVFKNPEQTLSYIEPVLWQFFQVHKIFLREMAKCGMLE